MEKIADKASETALKYFGKVSPSLKADRSYVTRADLEIEKMLRAELPALVPGSEIIGEETALTPDNSKEILKSEWIWIVDPVDGTGNFVDSLPNFCVSIGLARRGRPYAGLLKFPISGDVYKGVRKYGAFFNGRRISLKGFEPGYNTAFYTYSKSHKKYLIKYPGKIRNLGTTAGHLAITARGAGFGVLAHGAVWDYMGAAAVFLEAGGLMRYLDGTAIDWNETLTRGGNLKMPVVGSLPGKWKETAEMIVPYQFNAE